MSEKGPTFGSVFVFVFIKLGNLSENKAQTSCLKLDWETLKGHNLNKELCGKLPWQSFTIIDSEAYSESFDISKSAVTPCQSHSGYSRGSSLETASFWHDELHPG